MGKENDLSQSVGLQNVDELCQNNYLDVSVCLCFDRIKLILMHSPIITRNQCVLERGVLYITRPLVTVLNNCAECAPIAPEGDRAPHSAVIAN